jgi:glycosyltransferase involved in cell wall biosynthesis
MYKISVIIPVYNTEKYLPQCLDSVLAQTFQDFEIICINDGSKDNSLAILQEYAKKDKRIKVISYHKNKGGGYARNQGLKIAKGEYLAFLDSDDFFNLDCFEKIYTKCKDNNSDIGIFAARSYDELTKKYCDMPWSLRVDLLPDKDTCFAKDMYKCIFNFSRNWNWNKLFKRRFIEENEIKFQELYRTNDLLFTCKSLMSAEKISVISESLINYRIHHGTSCQQTNEKYPLDFYSAFSEAKKWLVTKELYSKVKKSFVEWALEGCVNNINSIKDERIKEIVQKKVFKEGINEFDLSHHNDCIIVNEKSHKNFDNLLRNFEEKDKLFTKQRIQSFFSVKNSFDKSHKIIKIFGIKISIRRHHA